MGIVEKVKEYISKHPTLKTIVGNRTESDTLETLYFELTGEILGCGGCADKSLMAYASLTTFLDQVQMENHPIFKNKIMANYTLKKGVLVYSAADARHYDEKTITDEAAEKLIEENPNNVQLFETMPDETADAIAKAEAEALAEAEAKQKAEEDAIAEALAKEEADAKAKSEADAKVEAKKETSKGKK